MALWSMLISQCPCRGGSRFPWGLWVLVAAGLYAVTWWAESVRKAEGKSRMMSKLGKLIAVVALIAAVGTVLVMKKGRSPDSAAQPALPANTTQASEATTEACLPAPGMASAEVSQVPARLPRLLDLGSTSCIPCRMMMPILEQLRAEQAGRLQVDFIDVWNDKAAGEKYRINVIPTQIFFDSTGKELWRHEGFFAKEEIVAKWKEMGVELPQAPASQPAADAEVR